MSRNARLETRIIAERLAPLGVSKDDAILLRRIEMTLQRWGELECGDGTGCIERDEHSGKAYWRHAFTGKRWPIPDRERGALKRLTALMARYTHLRAYHQTDPRGCALYVGRRDDMTEQTYTRGIAVCV